MRNQGAQRACSGTRGCRCPTSAVQRWDTCVGARRRSARASAARARRSCGGRPHRDPPQTTKLVGGPSTRAGKGGGGSRSASVRSASSRAPDQQEAPKPRDIAQCAAFTRSPCSSSVARARVERLPLGQPKSREDELRPRPRADDAPRAGPTGLFRTEGHAQHAAGEPSLET